MYYSLRGTLVYSDGYSAVVECAGVGYQCAISSQTYAALPQTGEQVLLYTALVVREDAMELYGFATDSEKKCFKILTSVSGVGAKVALAILSVLTADQVAFAVIAGDAKSLTAASGVGPKLAQRIVLELKDKFKGAQAQFSAQALSQPAVPAGAGNARTEAVAALMALGYTQAEALSALSGCDEGSTTEEMIRMALKALAGRL